MVVLIIMTNNILTILAMLCKIGFYFFTGFAGLFFVLIALSLIVVAFCRLIGIKENKKIDLPNWDTLIMAGIGRMFIFTFIACIFYFLYKFLI